MIRQVLEERDRLVSMAKKYLKNPSAISLRELPGTVLVLILAGVMLVIAAILTTTLGTNSVIVANSSAANVVRDINAGWGTLSSNWSLILTMIALGLVIGVLIVSFSFRSRSGGGGSSI
jgi:hypothetical protein